jgi:phytoene dehydrogenase-like protein
VTERYDAAIIGAGADGLAAAALLAGAGLSTILLERHVSPGGRLVTRQFHPGYFASPFADDVASVPHNLFWSLGLARHGAHFASAAGASAIWRDRIVPSAADTVLAAEVTRRRARALAEVRRLDPPPARWDFLARAAPRAWPAENWSHRTLCDVVCEHGTNSDSAALAMADALAGRAADPLAAGSALHLLAPCGGGVWRGGLGALGAALLASATAAGAEVSCGLEVSGAQLRRGRIAALTLADGRQIAARAVISTLDVKRTFLSLFAWSDLPKPLVHAAGQFRMAGSTARLLVALAAPPVAKNAPSAFLRGPIHVAPATEVMIAAHAAWRSGVVADRLPLMLRFDSVIDPGLAPPGAAVMTVTAGCVPHTPFDGAWTHDKRHRLAARILAAVEQVLPGVAASMVGFQLIVPPDIEDALDITAGDLMGGEIAPDQMFAFRPGVGRRSPYTPVAGLYLAGPSSAAAPFGTCVAGAVAASAVIADLRAGRLP